MVCPVLSCKQGDISLDSKSHISQYFRQLPGCGGSIRKLLLFKFIKAVSALLGPLMVSLLSYRMGHFSSCILVLIAPGVDLSVVAGHFTQTD